jgi:hypothetical protein
MNHYKGLANKAMISVQMFPYIYEQEEERPLLIVVPTDSIVQVMNLLWL